MYIVYMYICNIYARHVTNTMSLHGLFFRILTSRNTTERLTELGHVIAFYCRQQLSKDSCNCAHSAKENYNSKHMTFRRKFEQN